LNDDLNLEDRVRGALRAHGDRVRPDDEAGLDRIRHRGARARARRRAALTGAGMALTLVAALVVVPRLSDDDPSRVEVVPADDSSTTAPPEPAPTTTEGEPHGRVAVPSGVLWPPPDLAPFADPLDAARSFVEDYVGIDDPPLSAFRQTAPGTGEVDVRRRGEDGSEMAAVASVLTLTELDDGTWGITSALSEAILVDKHRVTPGAESTITVEGRGRGYEGTIVATVRERGMGAGESLAVEQTIAGCCESLEPFSVALTFARSDPPSFDGTVLLTTDSGLDGGVVDFTVRPVTFSTFSSSVSATPPGESLDVWFLEGEQLVAVPRARPESSGVLRAALEALLAGPTAEERAQGLGSAFGDGSEGLLAEVTITDGLAVVDFDDRLRETTGGLASASSAALLEQLNRTVLQFDTVERVEYRLGGSCDAFATWAHDRVCVAYERADIGDLVG